MAPRPSRFPPRIPPPTPPKKPPTTTRALHPLPPSTALCPNDPLPTTCLCSTLYLSSRSSRPFSGVSVHVGSPRIRECFGHASYACLDPGSREPAPTGLFSLA